MKNLFRSFSVAPFALFAVFGGDVVVADGRPFYVAQEAGETGQPPTKPVEPADTPPTESAAPPAGGSQDEPAGVEASNPDKGSTTTQVADSEGAVPTKAEESWYSWFMRKLGFSH